MNKLMLRVKILLRFQAFELFCLNKDLILFGKYLIFVCVPDPVLKNS